MQITRARGVTIKVDSDQVAVMHDVNASKITPQTTLGSNTKWYSMTSLKTNVTERHVPESSRASAVTRASNALTGPLT